MKCVMIKIFMSDEVVASSPVRVQLTNCDNTVKPALYQGSAIKTPGVLPTRGDFITAGGYEGIFGPRIGKALVSIAMSLAGDDIVLVDEPPFMPIIDFGRNTRQGARHHVGTGLSGPR